MYQRLQSSFGLLLTFILLFAALVPTTPALAEPPTTIFINELHYDNAGTDTNEGFEVAGPAGTDLSGYTVVFYNGNGGGSYNSVALSGVLPDLDNGYGVLDFYLAGIQNGAPDGLALVDPSDSVLQFLSYEGSFAATDGPAAGMTSTDIGVTEGSSTPLEGSLQLTGTGSAYEDFTWAAMDVHTFGAINAEQSFGGEPPVEPPDVAISEIRIDQPSDDFDEYFELAGAAGTSLDGVSYLVIGDGTGGSGVIENVTDLSGYAIGPGGYFVAAESTFSLGTADLTTSLNFENSDNVTHLLVFEFTGADGDDLDTDDDGILDLTPWTAEIDRIALLEEDNPPSGTEYHYGPPTVGPDGSYVPGLAFLCPGGWEIGGYDPADGDDTPGADNACGEPPVEPPDVAISEIRIDQPSTDNDEYFELAGAPGTSLDGVSYLVIGDGTGGSGVIENITDLSGYAIGSSGYFVAAEGTFSLGTADLTTSLNFENSDNVTHLLVYEFTGAYGDDLDTDDDGVLDLAPWAAEMDRIALIEEDNPPAYTEYHYGPPTVGPDGSFVPGQAYFCPEGWQIGAYDPVGGDDTPGADNACTVEPPEILINEIRIDQSGSDYDEFFELIGPSGASLDGLTYLVIGDGTGGSGVIENVTDLTGYTIGSGSYFVAAESSFSLGTADLTTSLNFENSDNVTHLLVFEFTGAYGDDLDLDDDGVLDSTPWTSELDRIALIEEENPPSGTEYHYGPPTVGPDGYYVPGFVYRCEDGWRIGPFGLGGETPGYENNCFFGFCGDPATFIHEVQGSGFVSPIEGSVVVVEGIVVADFQGSDQLSGFFLQEETEDYDAFDSTSEGVFVYDSSFGIDVNVGDVVRVQGAVDEYYDWTEVTSITNLTVCGIGTLPAPQAVNLPAASFEDLEQVENMLVIFPQTLTATESYTLGRYGEVALSANGRLLNPTQVVEPGQPAIDYQAANNLNRIQLEDGSRIQNPATVPYLAPDGTLRLGDTVTDLTGVISYSFGDYELQPTQEVTFTRVNERQPAPDDVGGRLTVASFNVLNYFTTIDDGSPICGPEFDQGCRGADSTFEFERQRTKIIEALVAMDADVVGLIELENNASASLADLVQGLNDVLGAGTYAYLDTGTIGGDAIKVGFIYKPATVSLIGDFAILDASVDSRFNDDRNRPALAQTFMENLSGETFTAVVNHLKSKGSPCDDIGDPDTGDGQGNCNLTRLAAAEAMTDWLATDPTGSGDPDFLIMGDLNSYAMEDPIDAILAAEYTNLIVAYNGYEEYSYVFDGQFGTLDHALSNPTLTEQVTGVTVWHINSDEPIILDYNTEYNPPELYQPHAYRSSDHDPVVIGLNLIPQCQGANATVYVDLNGVIVGGPWDGRTFRHNLRGTDGDDVIAGTDDHEVLDGRDGNDVICGYDGNDVLFGRQGDDILDGGDGNDVIIGWYGDDLLFGGFGADVLHGFFGADELHAGPGEDFLHGGHGYDLCDGGADNDFAVQCEVEEDIP